MKSNYSMHWWYTCSKFINSDTSFKVKNMLMTNYKEESDEYWKVQNSEVKAILPISDGEKLKILK
jgi:hypothetical protein